MLEQECPDAVVNCVNPGDVKSELSSYDGNILPEQAARTPIFLCKLLANEEIYRGKYVWYDRTIYDWYGPDPHELRHPKHHALKPECKLQR